jgi:hypothetical protein
MIKYFHIIDSRQTVSPLRMKCIRSLKDRLGDNEHRVVEVPYSDDMFELLARVDKAKYEIAATIPGACIVDTDCFISKPLHEFDIIEAVPYLARYDYDSSMTAPDICYFYVNGCTEWFKNNLPASLASKKQYGPDPDVFKRLTGFEYIPDMSYCHFYDSMRRVGDLAALDRAVKKLNVISSGIAHLNAVVNSDA